MTKKNKVTIIILNWNGKHFLKQNLNSVLSQDYKNFEVLVADNGSTDGSIKYIKKLKQKEKRLDILENGKNLGFTGGNNKGIKKVLKEGSSEFIVLLNNDIKVEKDWLKNLISGFNDNNIGICTSKILLYYPYQQIIIIPSTNALIETIKINNLDYHLLEFENGFDQKGERLTLPKKLKAGRIYNFAVPYDNQKQLNNGKLEITFKGKKLKVFSGEIKSELDKSNVVNINLKGRYVIQNAGTRFLEKRMDFEDRFIFEFNKELASEIVDAGCGGAMAIRCDLLKRLGVLNKNYFMYYEDSELCFRYQRAGFLTKFINSAVCYHHFWGSSEGEVTKLQTYYGTRNRLWFIRKYFGKFKFFYFYLRTFVRTLIWYVKSPFSKTAKMFYKSYTKALRDI